MLPQRTILLSITLLLAISAPLLGDAPAAPAFLAPDEIKSLFQSAKYKEASDAIRRLLAAPSPPAPPCDHLEMQNLRIECLVQLKAHAEAMSTLLALAAVAEKAGDPANAATYASLALLIQRSPHDTYTPKTGPVQTPLDILTPANRPAAYAALFNDELATLQARADDLKTTTTISPIQNLAPTYLSVHRLEKVAESTTTKTDAIAADLLTTAGTIFTTTMSSYDTKISVASANAQTEVPDNGSRIFRRPRNTVLHSHPAGLTPDETSTLQSIVTTCQQIHKLADSLSASYSDTSTLKPITAKADSLLKRAQTVLAGQPDPGDDSAPAPRKNKKNQ